MFEAIKEEVLGAARESGWFKEKGLKPLYGTMIEMSDGKVPQVINYSLESIEFSKDWQEGMPVWTRKYLPRAVLLDGLLGDLYFRALGKDYHHVMGPKIEQVLGKIRGMLQAGTPLEAINLKLTTIFEDVFGKGNPVTSDADAFIGAALIHQSPLGKLGSPVPELPPRGGRSRSTAVAYLMADSISDRKEREGVRDVLVYRAGEQQLNLARFLDLWHEAGPRRALELFEDFELGTREPDYHR
jgi:hypothetical protein